MKTTPIDVEGLLQPLCTRGVEKQDVMTAPAVAVASDATVEEIAKLQHQAMRIDCPYGKKRLTKR